MFEAEKSQRAMQLLSNHWDSNQTPEFCNRQNKIKNGIKYTVLQKDDNIGPSILQGWDKRMIPWLFLLSF